LYVSGVRRSADFNVGGLAGQIAWRAPAAGSMSSIVTTTTRRYIDWVTTVDG